MDPQTAEKPTPAPIGSTAPRRARLWPKIVFGFVLLLVLLWIATPFVMSMDWVRAKVETQASANLGVPVTLSSHEFGWFHGLTLEGLEIANPKGYSTAPALALDKLEGDISVWRLALGKIDLTGQIDGLKVRLEQREDGTSNFGDIFKNRPGTKDDGSGTGGEKGSDNSFLSRLKLDLRLHDGLVEVLQDGVKVESIANLSVVVRKAFGGTDLDLTLGADLERPGGGTPGRVDLEVDADASMARPAVVDLMTRDLDLARYRPLLSSVLEDGALTALEGVMGGSLQATVRGTRGLDLSGKLTIVGPKVAGALLGGLELSSERWLLEPNAKVDLPEGQAPTADVEGLLLDFGFARIEGMSKAEITERIGGGAGLGATWSLDVDVLLAAARGALGDALPAELQLEGGRLSGSAALPLTDTLPSTAEQILAGLRAAVDLELQRLTYEDWNVAGLGAEIAIDKGQMTLATSPTTKLNDGSLGLELAMDLNQRDTLPTELHLVTDGVMVQGSGAKVLQYFLPLLAGAADVADLGFVGAVQIDGTLSGPALPVGEEHWLAWANHWTGKGNLGLAKASFTPAPAIQSLLSLTGQGSVLSLESYQTKYSISNGAVATNLGKLSKLTGDLGMKGSVTLDGKIDYELDFTEWMAGHRDGARLLQALGDTRLTAKLTGDLGAPALGLPDLTELLLKAGQGALQKELEKGLGGALDRLFGGKKKD